MRDRPTPGAAARTCLRQLSPAPRGWRPAFAGSRTRPAGSCRRLTRLGRRGFGRICLIPLAAWAGRDILRRVGVTPFPGVHTMLKAIAVRIACLVLAMPAAAQCQGDINGDGKVDAFDLAVVLANWGTCPATIASVTPLTGSVLGGTTISISGTGLSTTSAVIVGGNACTGVQVLSPTLVRAVTPAGAVGLASVALTTATGSVLAPQPFNYVQQSVTSIVPSTGSYTGGTAITISGAYLAGTTAVTIGGVPATNLQVVDASTVTAITPPGSVGSVDVVVTGSKGTVTAVGGFTYSAIQVPAWATLIEAQPDPAVVYDAAQRAAIIATGLAWRVRDTATQMEFVLIPPGTFEMGCSGSNQYGCNGDENPVHQVTLTNAFYLGRYEVTQAQWQARMGNNPSWFQSASSQVPAAQVPNRPVEQVSWNTIPRSKGSSRRRVCVCRRKRSGSTHAEEARQRRSTVGQRTQAGRTMTAKLGTSLGTTRTQPAKPAQWAARQPTASACTT
ncbi:MAG: hypothetical protein EBR10_11010 [Planctomycetes bacterium]|nr:hypothetical protein [Planctomycetota bacterium]